MALIGRRKKRKKDDDRDYESFDLVDDGSEDFEVYVPPTGDDFNRSHGPFDATEVQDDVERVDLGALQVPLVAGMEFKLEIEQQTNRLVAANIALDQSTVQLQAFAAPRHEGVWDEIREEIVTSLRGQGAAADDVPGVFGREILAQLPAPDMLDGTRVVRFSGIDGPRWFLRAVFSGEAAHDENKARLLEDVVRGCVVVRGNEAMVPRDLLPLKLPASQPEQHDAVEESFDPMHRGPEITEIR